MEAMKTRKKPNLSEIQKLSGIKRSRDEISADRSLFHKPLLSGVCCPDAESNLFTQRSLCGVAKLGGLEAVNCIYQLMELTTCQVG